MLQRMVAYEIKLNGKRVGDAYPRTRMDKL